MKNENKMLIALLAIIVIIALVCAYFAFIKEENKDKKTDAIKIQEEYALLNDQINENTKQAYPTVNLKEDNPFVYCTEEEIINIIENKSGVIYFGFASCPWCRTMMPILESVASDLNIKEINYLNIQDIRSTFRIDENNKLIKEKEGSTNYYKILELLDEYLEEYTLKGTDGKNISTNEKRLYAPTVVVIKNGEISSFHVGTLNSHENGFDELTEEEKKELTDIYTEDLKILNEGLCTEGC